MFIITKWKFDHKNQTLQARYFATKDGSKLLRELVAIHFCCDVLGDIRIIINRDVTLDIKHIKDETYNVTFYTEADNQKVVKQR